MATLAAVGFFWLGSPARAGVIDFRDGVRTLLYGNRFTGSPPTGDFYGWAMAFGDIDGDGYTDFLSSSANAEGPDDTHAHEYDVYVIFGRPRAEMDSVYAVDTPGGADIVCYKGGFAMACEDVDNDGYDDMILSEAPFSTYPIDGGVYVIFGAPRDQLRTVYNFEHNDPDYTPPDLYIYGSTRLGGGIAPGPTQGAYDLAIRALVSGDINGDGYADIVAGNYVAANSPANQTTGAAYIIFGRPRDEFPPQIDIDYSTSLPHPDVIIWGELLEKYPNRLAIGDLDGDGVDDLVASTTSAPGEFDMVPGIGEIHGWWGKPEWQSIYYTQIDEFDFSLQGDGGYTLGWEMATGDVDGDGRDDLIVGSPTGNPNGVPPNRRIMGEYRILFGRPRGEWPIWGSALDLTDVLITGAQTGDAGTFNGPQEWGIAFSLATGNRDGDSYKDLLIGAGGAARPDGTQPGGAYVIRGRPRSAWEPFIDLRDGYDTILYGVDYTGSPGYQFDRCGFVTGMADIDGTGFDEMFVAAPFGDGPDNAINDCGEIYIVYDTGATSTGVRPPPAPRAALVNYPNPFIASTTFRIEAPVGETVSLAVYDALGREVARPLMDTPTDTPETEVQWTPHDAGGAELPSGVYFVKLRAGNESHARKILLLR